MSEGQTCRSATVKHFRAKYFQMLLSGLSVRLDTDLQPSQIHGNFFVFVFPAPDFYAHRFPATSKQISNRETELMNS